MGLVKSEWMESEERGWNSSEKNVCADCVSDAHLKRLIEAAATENECDYCGSSGDDEIAAPMEVVLEPVFGALTHYYSGPDNASVPYETAEGGYLIKGTDTGDALQSLPLECNDDLFEDIVDSIHNDYWVKAADGHWAGQQLDDWLIGGWKNFAYHVKHRQRFFFGSTRPEDPQDFVPSQLLPQLGKIVKELSLVRQIPADTKLYRARQRPNSATWQPSDETMGAPPETRASAGRMNPPGISYLYLSIEKATAVREVRRTRPGPAVIATFRATRTLRILDLENLPELPSLFDYEKLRNREVLLFLEMFVEEITQPARADGLEHIDYVPSQIVSEYFATEFHDELDGLLFPSAVIEGGRNLVVFPRDRFTRGLAQVEYIAWETV
jgi:RES domain-containing protein